MVGLSNTLSPPPDIQSSFSSPNSPLPPPGGGRREGERGRRRERERGRGRGRGREREREREREERERESERERERGREGGRGGNKKQSTLATHNQYYRSMEVSPNLTTFS